MNLDISNWIEFQVGELFKIEKGNTLSSEDREIYMGDIPCINGTADNNGVMCYLSKEIIEKGFKLHTVPSLTLSRVGNAGMTFVQTRDYVVADNAFSLHLFEPRSMFVYMFLSTILNKEIFKYSYGRTVTIEKYKRLKIKLPAQKEGLPDWDFMENYIKSIYCKPIFTKNKLGDTPILDKCNWKEFKIEDIFLIKYGVNLELNTCVETNIYNNDSVNFVSRTSDNNGVSARVNLKEGIKPQKSGLITVAGGGSVLSTFYQNEPFYSGRDLYVLDTKEPLSKETKFFLITIIEKNKYKYNYGRQANKTLSKLEIKLPVKHNADGTVYIDSMKKYSEYGYMPDWQFMEGYIKALPFGDRL